MNEDERLGMFKGLVDQQSLLTTLKDSQAWRKVQFDTEDELMRFK